MTRVTNKKPIPTTNARPPQQRRRRFPRWASRRPRGLPGLWSRVRRIIWAWWLWAVAAGVEAGQDSWGKAIGFGVTAVVAFLFAPAERAPTYGLDHHFPIESEEFLSTIVGATGTPFLRGNKIDIFNNGTEFYPAMLAEIEAATDSITIEAYIYWAGDVGRLFAQALAAKAKSGLIVKILLDAVGSSTIGADILETLQTSGCQIAWYHPIQWYTLQRINNRTHRKSLILDGRIAFTGGAGIADHWLGNAENSHHWRDIQIRIAGPAAMPLQTGFGRNWLETTGELVAGGTFYPPPEEPGTLLAQSIMSSPETGSSTVRVMYYLSIVCARRSILIANPYFVPSDAAIESLIDAKQRGVAVRIMVAGIHNDNALARRNSTRLYGDLLEAGIEVYEYNRTMMHHKYMVCDGIWSTIGTANFDNRSFALNEENNVCVYDRGFAGELEAIFERDLEACDQITLEVWRKRGLVVKTVESVASLLKEQV